MLIKTTNSSSPLVISIPHSFPAAKLRRVLKLTARLAVSVVRRARTAMPEAAAA